MKTTTVRIWLRVENNSKFVRGKRRARQDIEDFHLQQFRMKKLNEREYDLTFSYSDDEDLDRQVYPQSAPLQALFNALFFLQCGVR